MTELGNIFDAVARDGEGQRGADLRVEVTVPPSSLGAPEGIAVRVPLTIEGQRRADPHGDRERVLLRLPAELPSDGAVLRLRGLGALPTGKGAPGDLYVAIALGPEPPVTHRSPLRSPWLVLATLAALALGLWLLWLR